MEVHDIADLASRIGRGLMEQVFTTCRVAIALARTMKKDWHKAESAAKEITQQTAADAVGVSDSRISDYLNKKDYEDNAWVLAARFWHGLCADLQQLTIVADIIQTKLHHKNSDYRQNGRLVALHANSAALHCGMRRNPPNQEVSVRGRSWGERFGIICA